jgi:PEP-CTERM motif
MKLSFTSAAVAAVLSVCCGVGQAAVLATGNTVAGTTTFSFKMLSSSLGQFDVFLTSPSGQFAPTAVGIEDAFGMPLVPVLIGGTSQMTTLVTPLGMGEYSLTFVSSFTGGTFTIQGESNLTSSVLVPLSTSTPVPEPESVALVLAGLGVAGMLGRRRLGHGNGYAVPTYTA